MSLERTALRIATVMALSNGFVAPYPTMAGGRVFDSRFDPLQIVDLKSDDVLPLITVITDDDSGTSLSENNGGPPFEHTVTLCLDISIGMVGEIDEKPAFLAMPQSEPELEAMLDLFERQLRAALLNPINTWAGEYRKVARRMLDWKSARYVEADSNIRLAARKITASVMLQAEDPTELAIVPPADPPVIPPPLGPLLTTIIESGSPYAPSAEALAELLLDAGASNPITIPTLERVRFFESDQTELDGDDVAKGPRQAGVAEVELPIE